MKEIKEQKKKYVIGIENPIDVFRGIDSNLSKIEVKGDSVALLYVSRMQIKELFESVLEIDDEEGDEK